MAKTKQTTWNNEVFSIANAQGDPWTNQVFGSADAAGCYLKNYRLHNPGMRLGQHKVVPISVTIRVLKSK